MPDSLQHKLERLSHEVVCLKKLLFKIKLFTEIEPEIMSNGAILDAIADELDRFNFNAKYFGPEGF